MVDSPSADSVSVGELSLGVILGDVYHQVDSVVCDEVENVFAFLVGPAYSLSFDAVVVKELGCSFGGINLITVFVESLACVEHVNFTADIARDYIIAREGMPFVNRARSARLLVTY